MAPWLTITGYELDDWIYWRLILKNLNHNKLQKLTVNFQPNPSPLTAEYSLHSPSHSTTDCSLSQSQSYFKTAGLPTISLS
jgi:hypothetical protein